MSHPDHEALKTILQACCCKFLRALVRHHYKVKGNTSAIYLPRMEDICRILIALPSIPPSCREITHIYCVIGDLLGDTYTICSCFSSPQNCILVPTIEQFGGLKKISFIFLSLLAYSLCSGKSLFSEQKHKSNPRRR